MKKRLIGTLLMGALMVSSTSVFVSCKDYDDDINNIVATKADKSALQEAQTALEGKIASLKTQLEAEDAKLAALIATKANQTDLDAAVARIASLEARVTIAEGTIKSLDELIGGKLDNGKTYKAAVQEIYGRMETVEKDLGAALTRIEGLEKGLKDEETARIAAVQNLQGQLDALKLYAEGLEKVEIADKKELLEKINTLKTDIQGQIDTINGTITEMQSKMNGMAEKIDKVQSAVDVLTVLVNTSLRSLVFIPEFYYFGIEATEVNGIYTNFIEETKLPKVDPDKNDDTWSNGVTIGCWPYRKYMSYEYIVENWVVRYHLNPSTADLSKAELNVLQGDRRYVTKAVQDKANTNIAIATKDGKQSFEVKDGDLYVDMYILDPNKVKNIGHIEADDANTGLQRHFVSDAANAEDQMVTVFATEVTLNNEENTERTVTSDYAALRATKQYANGYRLAHTKTGDPRVKAPLAAGTAAGSYTGVANMTLCGVCGGWTTHTADNCHLFTDADETVYGATQAEVVPLKDQPYVGALDANGALVNSATTAQDVVFYNDTINLTKLVEVHRVGNVGDPESLVDAKTLKANGYEIQFELTGILMAGNKTSESAHAAVKKNDAGDYILRPQLPKYEGDAAGGQNVGKAAAYGATDQSRTNVGRTPLVRVKLVDTKKNNRVLDYGFIRLVIIDEYKEDLNYVTVEYNAGITVDYTYYNYACTQPLLKVDGWRQKWGSFEDDVYKHKLNKQLTQTEFEAKYDSILVQDLGLDLGKFTYATVINGSLAQYLVKFNSDGTVKKDANGNVVIDRACTEAEYVGNITSLAGSLIGEGTKTQVLDWTITNAQMKNWILNRNLSNATNRANKDFNNEGYLAAVKTDKLYRAVKYQVVDAANKTQIRDIYIVLEAADLKVTPNNDKVKATANFDTHKIKEYWYDENTQVTSQTLKEAHLNVPSPEDWIPTWQRDYYDENNVLHSAGAKFPFEFLLSSDFNKNNIPNYIWPDAFGTEALFNQYVTIVDPTPYKDFRFQKYQKYYFEFHKDNINKQYKGFSGKTYTMSLGSKKTLENGQYVMKDNWALLASSGSTKDTIAYLEYKDGSAGASTSINNIKIVLKKKLDNAGNQLSKTPVNQNPLINSFAEDLLNYKAHNDLDDSVLKAFLGVRLIYDCAEIIPDNYIQVRFLRPINVLSEDKEVQDAAKTTQEILLWDIIKLTDWREVWNPTEDEDVNKARRPFDVLQTGNKWTIDYWFYYNIKYILVGAETPIASGNDGAPLNGLIRTNLNGRTDWPLLSQISNNVEFTYKRPVGNEGLDEFNNLIVSRVGDPHFYGSILYTNNRSTVDNFDVKIPVSVVYEWGQIYNTEVIVKVRKTIGGNTTDPVNP